MAAWVMLYSAISAVEVICGMVMVLTCAISSPPCPSTGGTASSAGGVPGPNSPSGIASPSAGGMNWVKVGVGGSGLNGTLVKVGVGPMVGGIVGNGAVVLVGSMAITGWVGVISMPAPP